MNVLQSLDGTYSDLVFYNSFPSSNTFGYASSPTIRDIDQDNDLEIISGTTGDVIIYDIKESAYLSENQQMTESQDKEIEPKKENLAKDKAAVQKTELKKKELETKKK